MTCMQVIYVLLSLNCLMLPSQSIETVREWTIRINGGVRQSSHRPHSLLVLLNPFGGTKKARGIWRDIALPVFELAGGFHDRFEHNVQVVTCHSFWCQGSHVYCNLACRTSLQSDGLATTSPLCVLGIRCASIETERASHARQLVSELTLAELDSYDGIVAVSCPCVLLGRKLISNGSCRSIMLL